jgi:hypothetical protein
MTFRFALQFQNNALWGSAVTDRKPYQINQLQIGIKIILRFSSPNNDNRYYA